MSDNAGIIRGLYEAFGRGDVAGARRQEGNQPAVRLSCDMLDDQAGIINPSH